MILNHFPLFTVFSHADVATPEHPAAQADGYIHSVAQFSADNLDAAIRLFTMEHPHSIIDKVKVRYE